MTRPSERLPALLDTNVLVYAYDLHASEHAACARLVRAQEEGDAHLFLAPQILLEFFAILTHPHRCRQPRSQTEALGEMEKLSRVFPMLSSPDDVHLRAGRLVCDGKLGSRQIFDAALAVTALHNGVTHLYTYDDGFSRMPGITALRP